MVKYKPAWSDDVYIEVEDIRKTVLTIAIVDEAGNPISESVVGETVYVSGQLKDETGAVLQNALIVLYRNGVATVNTDTTNESGIYSIPYTVVSGDVPTVRFKTVFEGT